MTIETLIAELQKFDPSREIRYSVAENYSVEVVDVDQGFSTPPFGCVLIFGGAIDPRVLESSEEDQAIEI